MFLFEEPVEVVPGLWTTGQVERVTPFERVSAPIRGARRIIVVDGEEVDDQILDDLAVSMDVVGIGSFVITGCAHPGHVKTLMHVKKQSGFERIHGLTGGTHLVRRSDEYLDQTIEGLRGFRLGLVSPCHSTGFKATARLWRAFPKEFVLNYSCRVIDAGKEPEPQLV